MGPKKKIPSVFVAALVLLFSIIPEAADKVGLRPLEDNGTSALKIANSIWIDHNFKVKERFLERAGTNYYTEAFSADFRDPSAEAFTAAWVSRKTRGTIVPAFENDPGQQMSLFNTNAAFAADADFSGMANSFLSLSKVTQETHISVDGKGVEASAFTQSKPAPGAGPAGDHAPQIIEFTLDRPFVYGVLGNDNLLYFAGICADPNGG